jgi:excisionase family DNA binding protein
LLRRFSKLKQGKKIMDNDLLSKLESIENKLNEMQSSGREVLTFPQAARYLDVSRSHLYKLTAKKAIPHSKPRGKQVYFERRELDAWLLQGKQTTAADIEQAAADYVTLGKKAGVQQ